MKICPVCGMEMKEKNKTLECPNKCDRTTARGPNSSDWSRIGYEQIAEGCYVRNTKYIE